MAFEALARRGKAKRRQATGAPRLQLPPALALIVLGTSIQGC